MQHDVIINSVHDFQESNGPPSECPLINFSDSFMSYAFGINYILPSTVYGILITDCPKLLQIEQLKHIAKWNEDYKTALWLFFVSLVIVILEIQLRF